MIDRFHVTQLLNQAVDKVRRLDVAAIQAGRAGAKTLLVEKEGILGGTMVVAGVNAPGIFHAWGKQVIAGIGWELVEKTVREAGGILPDFTRTDLPHWQMQVRNLDKAVFAALADEAVTQAGVELQLHTMLAQVRREADHWQITLCTKTGLQTCTARVLVDCTGDANAVTMAGFKVQRNTELQPGTLVMNVGGYNAEKLDYPAIDRAFKQAEKEGHICSADLGWGTDNHIGFLRSYGGNRSHITGIDATTSEGKTAAEIKGRQVLLRIVRFYRAQPGLENLHIVYFATETGIRETVTILGKGSITGQDYESGRRFEDALCYSFYPIDIHRENGLVKRHLKPGVVPTIPRGALLPADSTFLIAAGRTIAGDQEANSAYRVQATCMATGQAAGAMAALAAQRNMDPAQLPLVDIRELLKKHGAIVP
jgi:hypothetical protein